MSEKEFWHCTPRKLNALLAVHDYFNNSDNKGTETAKEELVYIDDIAGF